MRHQSIVRGLIVVVVAGMWVCGRPAAAAMGSLRDEIQCDPDIGGTDHDCNGLGTPEGEWEQDPTCGLIAPGGNNTVTVTFDPALPDEACRVVALARGAEVCGCGLEGDTDRSGLVTTGDASIIKPPFGDTPTGADAEFDFDASGLISTGDFSQVKLKFGHAVPGRP